MLPPLLQNLSFKVHLIDIGTALAETFDLDEALVSQFLNMSVDRAPRDADVLRHRVLAWKAIVLMPCIGEQHGVYQFRT